MNSLKHLIVLFIILISCGYEDKVDDEKVEEYLDDVAQTAQAAGDYVTDKEIEEEMMDVIIEIHFEKFTNVNNPPPPPLIYLITDI